MNAIYLDNNATTSMLPEVWEAMKPFYLERFGNPASSHHAGRQARRALEDAREQIATLLDAQPDEVVYTSGATEANNLAILGLVQAAPGSIVTSLIEHPCVLEPIRALAVRGYVQANAPVMPSGEVDYANAPVPTDLRLAAFMLANHETGAVQPIDALVRNLGSAAPFHCDAAAAAGKMPISFRRLGVTSLTISAHKFHGPKGIGALLVRHNVRLRPQVLGGHQQQGKRPGTEPVPLAVGMATALAIAVRDLDVNRARLLSLRRSFLGALREHAAPVLLNGPEESGLPHALNLSFPGTNADALLMNLDLAGIACSTGSACSSGSLLPSPVLTAMGKTGDALCSAMRFSLSPFANEAEMVDAAQRITRCVAKLRTSYDGVKS